MDNKQIGKRIKKAREDKGITQEQLAELADLSATHVSVIERGVKTLKLDAFVSIANALEVSADALLIDVVNQAHQSTASELSELLAHLPIKERNRILNAVRALTAD